MSFWVFVAVWFTVSWALLPLLLGLCATLADDR